MAMYKASKNTHANTPQKSVKNPTEETWTHRNYCTVSDQCSNKSSFLSPKTATIIFRNETSDYKFCPKMNGKSNISQHCPLKLISGKQQGL